MCFVKKILQNELTGARCFTSWELFVLVFFNEMTYLLYPTVSPSIFDIKLNYYAVYFLVIKNDNKKWGYQSLTVIKILSSDSKWGNFFKHNHSNDTYFWNASYRGCLIKKNPLKINPSLKLMIKMIITQTSLNVLIKYIDNHYTFKCWYNFINIHYAADNCLS